LGLNVTIVGKQEDRGYVEGQL